MSGEGVLISIITPVFNSAKFIERTIISVLNQTYTNWELILVEEGSTDNSREIIERFERSDHRIKRVFNPDDKGPAHARYTGIKNSSGKYVAFIDADDIWNKEKLSIQVGIMETKNLPFTYTLCRELQQDEKHVSILLTTNRSFTYKQYLRKRGIYASTVVLRKELLTDDIISIWSKDSYDDTLWWILVMKNGAVATLVPYDLALYRLSPNQLSARRTYTIKKVYKMYSYFKELSVFQKNIYFIGYIFNSGIRQLQLKLLPKRRSSCNFYNTNQ